MKRIAIIEDNADNRLLLQLLLGDRFELTEYDTAAAARAGLRQQKPDLVLMDISLPDAEGTDLLRELRATPDLRALPVVALTAHAMAGDRERFLALGFDDYVSKPILDEAVLQAAIDRLLPGT